MAQVMSLQAKISESIDKMGYELIEAQFVASGHDSLLRIFIDSPDGVTLEDCERVSQHLKGVVAVGAESQNGHRLEVSSPGLDRLLSTPRHFTRFVGSNIRVKLHQPIEVGARFSGQILSCEGGEVAIMVEGALQKVPLDNIASARVIPMFEPGSCRLKEAS